MSMYFLCLIIFINAFLKVSLGDVTLQMFLIFHSDKKHRYENRDNISITP